MLRLSILATILTTGLTRADEPPPVPEGGINFVIEGKCTDQETGEKGDCYGGYTNDGTFYVTFWQDGVMMFIRKSTGTGYEPVWVNAQYNSY